LYKKGTFLGGAKCDFVGGGGHKGGLGGAFAPSSLYVKKGPVNFSFDFLGLDKVYFKNYFTNELI
jgi:hypothetical protein